MNGAYAQLLKQTWGDHCASRMMLRASAVALLAWITMLVLVAGYMNQPELARTVSSCIFAAVIYLWCGGFLKKAIRQNQPSYAGLVPRLRERLMLLAACLCIGSAVLAAAAVALVFGHFGFALTGAGLFLCYILFAQRYRVLAFLPSAVILAVLSMPRKPAQYVLDMTAAVGEPAVSAIGVILVVLLGWWALHVVFPRGGDLHWAWHRKYEAAAAGGAGKRTAQFGRSSVGRVWIRLTQTAYFNALKRDSASGIERSNHASSLGNLGSLDSVSGSAASRMLVHALGPDAHEGNGITHAVILMLLTLVASAAAPDAAFVRAMLGTSLMQVCILVMPLMYASSASCAVSRTFNEQSVYLLTPAAPSTPQLNRVLARALVLRFLRIWFVCAACAVCIDAAQGGWRIKGSTLALAAMLLPFGALMLRDYAARPRLYGEAVPVLGTLSVVVVYLAIMAAERQEVTVPYGALASAFTAGAGLLLAMRWRRMATASAAFPAGRLAR